MEDKINQIKQLVKSPSEATEMVTNKIKMLPTSVIVFVAAVIAFFI